MRAGDETGRGSRPDPEHQGLPSRDLSETAFDDLLQELQARVTGIQDERARWRLLLDAVVTMAADLSLDGLLSRIVEIASGLAGARYAALGVLGSGPERRLSTFVTYGVSPEVKARIGDLPQGHGLLGLIIDHPEPLRLRDIADHPASFGFPPGHPPMSSFLGVPIHVKGKVFGNLYLTEKLEEGGFTDQDEQIVVALAAAAGVAIDNARLHEEAARRERWLAATAEITALLSTASSPDALQVVVDRARELAGADVAWIVSGAGDDALRFAAVAGAPFDEAQLDRLPAEDTLAGMVIRTGTPVTVEELAGDPRVFDYSTLPGWPRLGPVIVVPLRSSSGVEGVLGLGWRAERAELFHAVDPMLPTRFAEQAALALTVVRAREDQQRLVVFEDRERIGRDLHDVVIQRLFAVGLGLQGTSRLVDRPDVSARLTAAIDELDATIKDIRRTIFELGSAEDATDVQAEVVRMAERAATSLGFRPVVRFEGPVRTRVDATVAPDLLAVLGEALSNAARHSAARSVSVLLRADEQITLRVVDDGRGLPERVRESGLANMRQRAQRRGGHCRVVGEPGAGTTVEWSVPAAGGRDGT